VTFPKAFLNRMQFAVPGQPFNGRNLRAVRLHRENGARLHRLAVHQDRACAANTRLTTDMRSSELAKVAQKMNEQHARLDFMLSKNSVDAHFDQSFHKRKSRDCRSFVVVVRQL
jgi:hypothetical protein